LNKVWLNLPRQTKAIFDFSRGTTPLIDCCECSRLVEYRRQTAIRYPHYYNKPVLPWGKPQSRLLIVGLAPGKHGANASGFPFCGDASGELLFKVLHQTGFSNRAQVDRAEPGSILNECCITNAVKCLPPQNRPSAKELQNCSYFLGVELAALAEGAVIVALGRLAHQAIIKTLGLRQKDYSFAHGAVHAVRGTNRLLDSYHCSRYNTQTGRLSERMLRDVFEHAAQLIKHNP
jgi:uracil-DNA glycosylase family 4